MVLNKSKGSVRGCIFPRRIIALFFTVNVSWKLLDLQKTVIQIIRGIDIVVSWSPQLGSININRFAC